MTRARRSLADAVLEMAHLQNSPPGPPAVTSRKSRVVRRSWTSYDLQTTIFAGLLGLAQIFAFWCIFLPSEESNFRFQPHLFVSARLGGEGERSAATVDSTLEVEGPDEVAKEVLPNGYFLQEEGSLSSWSAEMNSTREEDLGESTEKIVLPSGYFLQGEGSWSAVGTNSPQPDDHRFVSTDHSGGTSSTLEDAAEIVPDRDLSEHRHDEEDADSAADEVDEIGYREQHVEQPQQHKFPSAMRRKSALQSSKETEIQHEQETSLTEMASSFTGRSRETVAKLIPLRLGLTVVPWGVLGSGGSKHPGSSTVIVDPAGLLFMQGRNRLSEAGGASGAIYDFIGGCLEPGHPHPTPACSRPVKVRRSRVQSAVDAAKQHFITFGTGSAKFHKYNGKTSVIHAVGPNFRIDKSSPKHKLATTYENIFLQAAAARKTDDTLKHLRLLPVSSGVFNCCEPKSGFKKCSQKKHHKLCVHHFPEETAAAILMGWEKIGRSKQLLINEFASVTLCIYNDVSSIYNFADYRREVGKHATLYKEGDPDMSHHGGQHPASHQHDGGQHPASHQHDGGQHPASHQHDGGQHPASHHHGQSSPEDWTDITQRLKDGDTFREVWDTLTEFVKHWNDNAHDCDAKLNGMTKHECRNDKELKEHFAAQMKHEAGEVDGGSPCLESLLQHLSEHKTSEKFTWGNTKKKHLCQKDYECTKDEGSAIHKCRLQISPKDWTNITQELKDDDKFPKVWDTLTEFVKHWNDNAHDCDAKLNGMTKHECRNDKELKEHFAAQMKHEAGEVDGGSPCLESLLQHLSEHKTSEKFTWGGTKRKHLCKKDYECTKDESSAIHKCRLQISPKDWTNITQELKDDDKFPKVWDTLTEFVKHWNDNAHDCDAKLNGMTKHECRNDKELKEHFAAQMKQEAGEVDGGSPCLESLLQHLSEHKTSEKFTWGGTKRKHLCKKDYECTKDESSAIHKCRRQRGRHGGPAPTVDDPDQLMIEAHTSPAASDTTTVEVEQAGTSTGVVIGVVAAILAVVGGGAVVALLLFRRFREEGPTETDAASGESQQQQLVVSFSRDEQ